MATARQLYQDRFGLEPKFLGNDALSEPLTAMLRRRSHRAFRPEKLPDDLLEALLACSQSAPSKSDLQQFSIVLIDDADTRRVVMGPAPSDEWMRTAPHVAVFCADMRRGQRIAVWHARPHNNDSLDTFLNASVDAGLALGFLMAAAEASGVGCCPISLIRDRITDVTRVLALPSGVYPVAGFCFGWPAREGEVSMRLPPSVVVHHEASSRTTLLAMTKGAIDASPSPSTSSALSKSTASRRNILGPRMPGASFPWRSDRAFATFCSATASRCASGAEFGQLILQRFKT